MFRHHGEKELYKALRIESKCSSLSLNYTEIFRDAILTFCIEVVAVGSANKANFVPKPSNFFFALS